MVITQEMIIGQWNRAASATVTVDYSAWKSERLKMYDYGEATMRLSDMKARARLFRRGIN